jgi:hypothetical protein
MKSKTRDSTVPDPEKMHKKVTRKYRCEKAFLAGFRILLISQLLHNIGVH